MTQETTIAVNDIYHSIQGEGVKTGVPMVVLRLQGCSVGCVFCDTKETWQLDDYYKVADLASALGVSPLYTYLDPVDIAIIINLKYPDVKWVMLTGGEPSEQQLCTLLHELHQAGKKVAIETSGTSLGFLCGEMPDHICVSPKVGNPSGATIKRQAMAVANEIKHVVGIQKHIDELDALLKEFPTHPDVEICLQPMSMSTSSTELCYKVALERGWRVSIQVHKLLGVK